MASKGVSRERSWEVVVLLLERGDGADCKVLTKEVVGGARFLIYFEK